MLDAVYRPNGEMERVNANFEQHYEGASPALLGQIQFDRSEFDRANLARLMQLQNKIQEFSTPRFSGGR